MSANRNIFDLYKWTQNQTIEDEIRKELKGIPDVGGNFVPYGDKRDEFPKRFRGILSE
jgi:hypothetical protein